MYVIISVAEAIATDSSVKQDQQECVQECRRNPGGTHARTALMICFIGRETYREPTVKVNTIRRTATSACAK